MNNLATTSHLGPNHNKQFKPKTKNKTKPNRPPVKVVYISNPMRVTTSACRFRDLVQRLTGRDSKIQSDPTAYEVVGDDDDVLVGGGDDVINKSAEGSTTTPLSEDYYGDEFLMVGDFPDLGSEGLLWTTTTLMSSTST